MALTSRTTKLLLVQNNWLRICTAELHHRKFKPPILSSHKNWKYPEPATRNDVWRKKCAEDASMGWAKELVEYQKKKRKEQEEGKEKEAHMIHVVRRIKDISGRPWWEKEIVMEFGLEKKNKPVPLKNSPYVNEKLKHIKHLISIKPLSFPHGLPEHESDYEHTELRMNGELRIKKRLPQFERDSSDANPREKYELKKETWHKDLERQKQNYTIHLEYFKADYVYEYNQDKQEYRYKKYGYGKVED